MKGIILFILLCLLAYAAGAHGSTKYSDNTKVQNMIRILKTNSTRCLVGGRKAYCRTGTKPSRISIGSCYRYVKVALLESMLVPSYLKGRSAVAAGRYLKKEGFVNILHKHKNLSPRIPIGAILVYWSKTSKHGHIEVKTGPNEFTSDHIRNKINGRLIGIYVKKALMEKPYANSTPGPIWISTSFLSNVRLSSTFH